MKNFFKSIFVLGAAALFAVSCNVDNIGTLFENSDNNAGVSFLSSVANDTEISASQSSFVIKMGRRNAEGAQTVNLSTTLPEGIKVPSSVSFAAGEASADLVLDLSEMAVGKAYKGTIKIESDTEENVSIDAISCTFQKAYTWSLYGTGTYHYNGDDCFFSGDDAGLEIYKADGFDVFYVTHWGYDVNFNFSMASDGTVHVDDGPTGYTHSSYGPVRVVDCSDYFSDWDPKVDGCGYYDAATKTYYFTVVYYVSAGYFGYGVESFEMD